MINELLIVNLLMSKYTLDEVHKLNLLIYALILSLSKSEQKEDAPNTKANSSEKSSIDDSVCKNSVYKQSTSSDTNTVNSTDFNASKADINTTTNTNTNAYTNTNIDTDADDYNYSASINNSPNISLKTNINTNAKTNNSDENIFNLLKNGFQGTNTTLLLTSGETVTGQVLGSYYGNVIMIKVDAIIKFIDGNSIIGFY